MEKSPSKETRLSTQIRPSNYPLLRKRNKVPFAKEKPAPTIAKLTPEKPQFQCKQKGCSKVYTTKGALLYHIKQKHPKVYKRKYESKKPILSKIDDQEDEDDFNNAELHQIFDLIKSLRNEQMRLIFNKKRSKFEPETDNDSYSDSDTSFCKGNKKTCSKVVYNKNSNSKMIMANDSEGYDYELNGKLIDECKKDLKYLETMHNVLTQKKLALIGLK